MNILSSLEKCNQRLESGFAYCTGNTLSIDAVLVSAKAYQALGILSDFFSGSSVRDIHPFLSILHECRAFSVLPGVLKSSFRGHSFSSVIFDVSNTVVLGALVINGFKRVFSTVAVPSITAQSSPIYSLSLLTAEVPSLWKRIDTLWSAMTIMKFSSSYKRWLLASIVDGVGAVMFSAVHFFRASPEVVRLAWAVSSLCSFGRLVSQSYETNSFGRSFRQRPVLA